MSSFIQLNTPYKKELLASKFTVSIYDFVLFERISILVNLYDDNNILIDTKRYILENDEYNNWSNAPYNGSDEYINDFVKNKLC